MLERIITWIERLIHKPKVIRKGRDYLAEVYQEDPDFIFDSNKMFSERGEE